MRRQLALAMGLWLVLGAPALGASGKVKKAEKALEAFRSGDRGALHDARELLDGAVQGGDADDAEAWALRGRVYLRYLENPDLQAPPDPGGTAVEAYTRALDLGASGDALATELAAVESATLTALVGDVESKRWDDAAARLELAVGLRALGERLAGPDPDRAAQVRRLGVRIEASRGQLDAAREHLDAYLATGRYDGAICTLLARALAEAERTDEALALLSELAEAHPDDGVLLRAEVELRVAAGDGDGAVERLDGVREELSRSASGGWLLGELYREAGAEDRALEAWDAVVALDPRHLDARVALGLARLGEASAMAEALASFEGSLGERREQEDALSVAWDAAEAHLQAARELDADRREVLEGLVTLYEGKGDTEQAEAVRAALPAEAP